MKKNIILLFLFTLVILIIPFYINVDDSRKIDTIKNKIIECSKNNTETSRKNCIEPFLKTNIELHNFKELIKSINNNIELNPNLKNNCHEITHLIGSAAYNKHKNKALTKGFESCGEGYYHGVMASYYSTQNKFEKLVQFCQKYPNESRENNLCYHGIGHTYSQNYQKNYQNIKNNSTIFIRDLNKFCIKLQTDLKEIYGIKNELIPPGCFSGGFSQYIEDTNIYLYKKEGKLQTTDINICPEENDNILIECNRLALNYNILAILESDDFKNKIKDKIIRDKNIASIYEANSSLCAKIKTNPGKIGCFRGLATSYVTSIMSKNINPGEKLLSELTTDQIAKAIKDICYKDETKNCKQTFINELTEKIPLDKINNLLIETNTI